jgi:protein-tyrosine phosphatase
MRFVDRYRICFVCSGNICRSPTAEIVTRRLAAEAGLAELVAVDSAGTGDWHVGDDADPRALGALAQRGYDPAGHCARQFQADDFAERELVIALDRGHYRELRMLAPTAEDAAKVRLLRSFDPAAGDDLEVPDPYYGGADGFAHVLDLVEAACRGLLAEIRPELGAPARPA